MYISIVFWEQHKKSTRRLIQMSQGEKIIMVDIPPAEAVHQEYETKPIVDFFDDEDRQRRYTTGRKLAAKKELVIPAAEAERDSKWAQANGIPEGIDFVLFV